MRGTSVERGFGLFDDLSVGSRKDFPQYGSEEVLMVPLNTPCIVKMEKSKRNIIRGKKSSIRTQSVTRI